MNIIRAVVLAAILTLPLGGCVMGGLLDMLSWAGCPAKSVPPDAASQRAAGCLDAR